MNNQMGGNMQQGCGTPMNNRMGMNCNNQFSMQNNMQMGNAQNMQMQQNMHQNMQNQMQMQNNMQNTPMNMTPARDTPLQTTPTAQSTNLVGVSTEPKQERASAQAMADVHHDGLRQLLQQIQQQNETGNPMDHSQIGAMFEKLVPVVASNSSGSDPAQNSAPHPGMTEANGPTAHSGHQRNLTKSDGNRVPETPSPQVHYMPKRHSSMYNLNASV